MKLLYSDQVNKCMYKILLSDLPMDYNTQQHAVTVSNGRVFFKQNVVLISDQCDVTILILGTVVIAAQ